MPEQPSASTGTGRFVGFTAVTLNNGGCQYQLTYDASATIQVKKTCPDNGEANMTHTRTYSTTLEPEVLASLQMSLDRLGGQTLLPVYTGGNADRPAQNAYAFNFLAETKEVVAVQVASGSEQAMPQDLLQIYRHVVDGNIRSMQNANDAVAQLVPVDDAAYAAAVVKVTFARNQGAGTIGCRCDGNPNSFGTFQRTMTVGEDATVERWSGCRQNGAFAGDPNQGMRCSTLEVSSSALLPAQWAVLKKNILAAQPLALVDHYACGSYLECLRSDYDYHQLTIDVGPVQRETSWPSGEEAQLPASLQYMLSVLPESGF